MIRQQQEHLEKVLKPTERYERSTWFFRQIPYALTQPSLLGGFLKMVGPLVEKINASIAYLREYSYISPRRYNRARKNLSK